MSHYARAQCETAQGLILSGEYVHAIVALRCALKQTTSRRVWSKLMLAIRELSRIAPTVDHTS